MRALGHFEFFSQSKFISGLRALEHLPSELETYGAGKPLVVAGKDRPESGTVKKFIKAFYDSAVTIGALYDGVPAAPDGDLAGDLAKLFRERECDAVIALGGGPAVDVAKAIRLLVAGKTADLARLKASGVIDAPGNPLIFVPAGVSSGYEAAKEAVIDGISFVSDHLYPDIICIDPRMREGSATGPMAESAITALAHAIEAIDPAWNNTITESYGHTALRLISENLAGAIKNPSDKTAWMAMTNAAAMAGIAYSNAPAGMVHCLGRALKVVTGAPEGMCMGILLPRAMEKRMKKRDALFDEALLAMTGPGVYSATPPSERAGKFLSHLRQLLSGLSGILPGSLKDLGVNEAALKDAAAAAVKINRKLVLKECMDILRAAWHGSPAK